MAQLSRLSLEQLEGALLKARQLLEEAHRTGLSGNQLAEAQARVDALTEQLEGARLEEAITPGARSIQEWKDLTDALEKGAQEFERIGSAAGGTIGKILGAVGSIAAGTTSVINTIVQVSQASQLAIDGAARAATGARAGVALRRPPLRTLLEGRRRRPPDPFI